MTRQSESWDDRGSDTEEDWKVSFTAGSRLCEGVKVNGGAGKKDTIKKMKNKKTETRPTRYAPRASPHTKPEPKPHRQASRPNRMSKLSDTFSCWPAHTSRRTPPSSHQCRESALAGGHRERELRGVGRHGEYPDGHEILAGADERAAHELVQRMLENGGDVRQASQAPLERRYTLLVSRVIFKLCVGKCSRRLFGIASSSEEGIRLLGGEVSTPLRLKATSMRSGKRLPALGRSTSRPGIHAHLARAGTPTDARAVMRGQLALQVGGVQSPPREARLASRDVRMTRKRPYAFAKPSVRRLGGGCGCCMQPVSHSPPALPAASSARATGRQSPARARFHQDLPTFLIQLYTYLHSSLLHYLLPSAILTALQRPI
ncbi:hypothetical protein FB451DRAFT_1380010 [Mycena latifolia]|nr:hypothetical protein FB451DRAFT_1380010 [Mycena latifolia]